MMYMYRRTGERRTVSREDVIGSVVGSRWVVCTSPASPAWCSVGLHFTSILLLTEIQQFVVSVELSWLHDDECEQASDSNRATSDEVIVAGAFAVVLMNLGLLLRCELLALCACWTCSSICLVLSSAVDRQRSGQQAVFRERMDGG